MLSTQATPSRSATDALASPNDAISGARSLPNQSLTRSPMSSISTSLMRSTSEPFRETHKRASQASRSRSQSPSRSKLRLQLPRSSEVIDANATFVSSPALSTTSSYTNDKSVTSQSGRSDKSARRKSASSEQSESYVRTRDRVSQAVGLVLGTASSVTRDALFAGVDLLQFAPIPALGIAGSILVSIWQAIETIESNDIHCLRLAERCADTLLAVHHLAEPDVALELAEPVHKLQEVFAEIQSFLEKQSQRPFLHRYLKREEVRRSVGHCEASLGDALGLFMIKIQLHTLRAVKGVRDRRRSQAYSIATSDSSSAYTVSALLGPESSTSTYALSNQEEGRPRDAGYEMPSTRTILETLNASDPLDALERELAESGASALKRLSDIMSDLSVSSWTVTECGTEEAYMEDEDDDKEEGLFQPPPGRASHIAPWDSPMSSESSLYDSSCESSLASSPACSPVDLPWPHTDSAGNDKSPIAPDRSEPNTLPLVEAVEDTRTHASEDHVIEQLQETDPLENIPSPIWPSLIPAQQEQDADLLTFRSRCMAYGTAVHPEALEAPLEVNPILAIENRGDGPAIKSRLVWNMLSPSHEACMSTNPTRRWFEERIEPATFPPVTHLYLMSAAFPWAIFVAASSPEFGVSCGDLTGALSGVLQSHLPPSMWGEKGDPQRQKLKRAYRKNRSNVAGSPGHRLGEGMRFADILGSAVTFSGLYPLCQGQDGPPIPGVLAVLCT